MVLTVDLQCHKCYKKVKKVLCKFPQIQDQAYDEKQNHVVIKVVCCSPKKIRDMIYAKGGCAIKSIEIKEAEKQTPPSSPTPKPPPPNQSYTLTVIACCTNCYHGYHGGPCQKSLPCCMGHCQKPPAPPKTENTCCTDCYHTHHGGSCQSGSDGIVPYIECDGYCRRPVYDSGCGRSYGCNYGVARSDCFSEENSQGCTVM